jgi:hypothetical protein
MADRMSIEGLVDLEVRGEHIAGELLRDVAVAHGGAYAPTADLGPSFRSVGERWHEDRDGQRDWAWHGDEDVPSLVGLG